MKEKIATLKKTWQIIRTMPRVDINLHLDKCEGNHPFFAKITQEFFNDATKRHRKLPLIRQMEYGVALFLLDNDPDTHLKAIESSARRNFKKALRNGYYFKKINFNDYLDDIWDIRRSTKVRQGDMPEEFINKKPSPRNDPESLSNSHDYAYFGIFNKDHKLVAYAGCFIAGELCMIEHIYGHSDYQKDGVVPMLIISMAQYVVENYPLVKVYSYGTFLGANPSMQRFKKKFRLLPHKVTWYLTAN